MKIRWRKIVAILGVVTMIGSAFPVAANEPTNDSEQMEEKADLGEETPDEEETNEETLETAPAKEGEAEILENATAETVGEKDSDNEESDAEAPAKEDTAAVAPLSAPLTAPIDTAGETPIVVSEAEGLQAFENLRWNEKLGKAVFYNPNSEPVSYILQLYKFIEGEGKWGTWRSASYVYEAEPNSTIEYLLSEIMDESGTYKYGIKVVRLSTSYEEMKELENQDTVVDCDFSEVFEYTIPNEQIEVPKNITFTSKGVVSWDAVDHAGSYSSQLYYRNIAEYVPTWKRTSASLSHDHAEDLESGYEYYVRVRALSSDITQYRHSDWSDYIPVNASGSSSSSSKSKSKRSEDVTEHDSYDGSSDSVVYVEPWKPVTPDEIKRYSVVGKEKPEFTVNAAGSYSVAVMNAMQGKLCYDSFEAVLGDYTIGRTYNIFPAGKIAYKMDEKAKITLNIPKDLQKDNRTFKMICVTQNGQPIVLNDLGTDPKTITFETDTYYAFALTYKDAAASR